ncbi:MAG TPA: helix-turn-helix transcriptional regulator [Steroidobacteraceae bacterium]|jgi:transcriptional regulator with XRE-family HTH domain|nr:helix-turn-helix transcriptional regulator [Steroidobacteraceae bacterium]
MKIAAELTDAAVLQEIGERLERRRLDAELTQARLAEEAGVSKRTVERIESGRGTDFVMLLRVLRVLNLLDALDQWVPDLPQSPLVLLKGRGRARKRVGHARRPRDGAAEASATPPRWKWRE